jgi:hypothetical protein
LTATLDRLPQSAEIIFADDGSTDGSAATLDDLPGTASGWTGIEKLEPGTILTLKDGRVSRERYWVASASRGK